MALQKEKLAEFDEKYGQASNMIMIQRNKKSLMDGRVLTTIFTGIAAGILGFDGPLGVIFYFGIDFIVSMLMLFRFGFKAEPYFTDVQSIFTTGLVSNVMTFMVTWVLFHNLVYIL